MDQGHNQFEDKNKRKSAISSICIHVFVLLLAFLPLLNYPVPPPGQQGILVNLGIPNVGHGIENAGPSKSAVEEERNEPNKAVEKKVLEKQARVEPVKQESKKKTRPEPKKVVLADNSEMALREQRKIENERKEEQELEDQMQLEKRQEEIRKQEAAEEQRKKLEAERQKKEAEAKRKADADAVKDQVGGLFGSSGGKGNTVSPGNQGDPGGDPNASVLEGISTGSGMIGGGLGDRGVVYIPTIKDNSQDDGKVVVKVCVNSSGQVVSAKYTLSGSTATNGELIRLAEKSAMKFKFEKGNLEMQCGTITIDFQLK